MSPYRTSAPRPRCHCREVEAEFSGSIDVSCPRCSRRWHATFWPRLYARFIWPVQRWLGTGAWARREHDRQHRAYLVRLASWRATWGQREVGDDGKPAPTPPCPPPTMVREC